MVESKKPACKQYEVCGGCSRQTFPYHKQLQKKENKVKNLLNKAKLDNYNFLGIIPSPDIFEYRNKMEFSFGNFKDNSKLQLGLHPKGNPQDVVTVDTCKLVDNDFKKILTTTLDYCRKKNFKSYDVMERKRYLRNLVIRKGINTGEILINLVTTSQYSHDFTDLLEKLKNMNYKGEIVGFIHTINDSYSDAVECDKLTTHEGRNYFYEKLNGLKFKVTPFSFFQVNTKAAEKLFDQVKDFIPNINDKTIFDLYCGTGTIGQMLSTENNTIIGIEILKESVEVARENMKINNLKNCKYYTGEVLKKIDEVKENPDLIVLDPPRPGVHHNALEKIIQMECEEIIYISCNPDTLVRDLHYINDIYQLKEIKCVDMFPHTPHVESCCRLTLKT